MLDAGDSFWDVYYPPNGWNCRCSVQQLSDRDMARLKLDPSQADQFLITLEGNALDESKTLAELGISENAVLLIERREAVKI